jgi:hypothetical protein
MPPPGAEFTGAASEKTITALPGSSCAGLTRASIRFRENLSKWMDCRVKVKPGNDVGIA